MEGLISSLFNRAILDLIAGVLLLTWIQLLVWVASDVSLLAGIEGSSAGDWSLLVVLGAGFVAGSVVDRLAYQILDRRLFWRAFASRRSSLPLPPEVVACLEGALTLREPARGAAEDGIDESNADVISATFWVKARAEAIAKRADLVANFQFNSNLLLIACLFVPLTPWLVRSQGHGYGVASLAVLSVLAVVLFLWRASIAAIGRIHTLENLYILGLFVDGWRPPADADSSSAAPPRAATASWLGRLRSARLCRSEDSSRRPEH